MTQQYASVTDLAKIFAIGRTKTTELVHQMEIDPDFKKNVNIEAFREFLVTKISRQWVK